MEKQPNLTPEQSLDLIQLMISKARGRVCADGYYLILWGTLISIAQLITYFNIKLDFNLNLQVMWYVTLGLGFAGSLAYGILVESKRGKGTHLDLIYGFVWITFFISWMIAMAFQKVLAHESIIIFLACANAVLLTGIIIRFKPLIIGSIFLYATTLIGLLLAPDWPKEILLIFTGGLIAGYIIPGLMLNRKIRKEKKELQAG